MQTNNSNSPTGLDIAKGAATGGSLVVFGTTVLCAVGVCLTSGMFALALAAGAVTGAIAADE